MKMKKKRYTKPVVIDLGKQTPDTIKNGLLSWNRKISDSDQTESCVEGAAFHPDYDNEDQNTSCDENKNLDKE
jgi:hypothetical protein